MSDNVARVPQAINIEMADRTAQPIITGKGSNPENGNGVTDEQRAVVSPQVKDLANKNPDDDFINGLIAGLDDMTQGAKESKTKKIEKKTKDKVKEAIEWVAVIADIAYVFL